MSINILDQRAYKAQSTYNVKNTCALSQTTDMHDGTTTDDIATATKLNWVLTTHKKRINHICHIHKRRSKTSTNIAVAALTACLQLQQPVWRKFHKTIIWNYYHVVPRDKLCSRQLGLCCSRSARYWTGRLVVHVLIVVLLRLCSLTNCVPMLAEFFAHRCNTVYVSCPAMSISANSSVNVSN